MKNEDESIVQFCVVLAKTREMFRSEHIHAEMGTLFKQVTTTISHACGNFNESLLKGLPVFNDQTVFGVEISYSLDAELKEMIDDDKYSMGASLAIRSLGNRWLLQGEVGWSCKSCGWDDYESFEQDVDSARDLVKVLPEFCGKMLSSYRALVDAEELDSHANH